MVRFPISPDDSPATGFDQPIAGRVRHGPLDLIAVERRGAHGHARVYSKPGR
ncbi:MAG: hypothetical protein N3D71_02970 [Burkholderiaceae bacterium]|jgi:hypothetical protein|nr:hypothetical protein [Burkholderiaceae bacterium]